MHCYINIIVVNKALLFETPAGGKNYLGRKNSPKLQPHFWLISSIFHIAALFIPFPQIFGTVHKVSIWRNQIHFLFYYKLRPSMIKNQKGV